MYPIQRREPLRTSSMSKLSRRALIDRRRRRSRMRRQSRHSSQALRLDRLESHIDCVDNIGDPLDNLVRNVIASEPVLDPRESVIAEVGAARPDHCDNRLDVHRRELGRPLARRLEHCP